MRTELVVVAHPDTELRTLASELLRAADHCVIAVGDGESARCLLLATDTPKLLIAGVALTAPPFYGLCKLVRDQALPTRVLLISSTHSAAAYKRAPTDLYGADDYVEEHRLESDLVGKVRELLTREGTAK